MGSAAARQAATSEQISRRITEHSPAIDKEIVELVGAFKVGKRPDGRPGRLYSFERFAEQTPTTQNM